MSVEITVVEQQDVRLGRHKVHDSRSLAFPLTTTVDRATWKNKSIRIYDPAPNPEQLVGCCTGVSKCSQLNAAGNRVSGRVLNLKDAEALYSWGSSNDPWEGAWPPQDTGSSGLASAKAAEFYGVGGQYLWIFGGADEVVQNVMDGKVISVGTWWDADMLTKDADGRVHLGGGRAGGHQYVIRGYHLGRDAVMGRCWWGTAFKDFWLARADLDTLLHDEGDAHWQVSAPGKDVA